MIEALKPCPFCGHVGLSFSEGSTFRWLAYCCDGCGIGSETRVQTAGSGTKESWLEAAKADAISEWNQRAAIDAALAQADAPADERKAFEAWERTADGLITPRSVWAAAWQARAASAPAQSNDARAELVVAVHTLASHYENALGAFGDDDEGKRKAEGDIAHAMKIAAKYNWNGRAASAPAAPGWQPISTAPKDGTLFLCWVSAVLYRETDEGQLYEQDISEANFCSWRTQTDIPDCGWFEPCCGQIGDSQGVTLWMPLPAAPKEPKP